MIFLTHTYSFLIHISALRFLRIGVSKPLPFFRLEIAEKLCDWVTLLLICHPQFRPEMLDTLYSFAKFQYECGNYSGAADYLYLHRGLVPISDKVQHVFPLDLKASYLLFIIIFIKISETTSPLNFLSLPPFPPSLLFFSSLPTFPPFFLFKLRMKNWYLCFSLCLLFILTDSHCESSSYCNFSFTIELPEWSVG